MKSPCELTTWMPSPYNPITRSSKTMRRAWTRRRALAAGALQPIVTPIHDQSRPPLRMGGPALVELQPANLVLAPLADVEKSVLVQREAGRRIDDRLHSHAPIAVLDHLLVHGLDELGHAAPAHRARVLVATLTVPGHRGDDAGPRFHAPHPVVHRIGDVHVPERIEEHRLRSVEHGLGGRLAVTVVAVEEDARHRGHNARLHLDLPDAVAALIRHVDIVLPIHGDG